MQRPYRAGYVPPWLLRAEGLPGQPARLEVWEPYLEAQGKDEELAQTGQDEVEPKWLPITQESHVG